jgi:glutamate-5-semialdehyde dehydrogenase
MEHSVRSLVVDLAQKARAASPELARAETARKDAVLRRAAAALRGPGGDPVLAANGEDVAEAVRDGLSGAMLDRLRLDRARLDGVAAGVEEVAALPDPVGAVVERRRLDNGLEIGRMRVPLGVVAIIYESRPNVTADAAALCIKSGNAVVLRGGSEAFRTNRAIASIFAAALEAEGLPPGAAAFVPTTDRAATLALLGLKDLVDVVIPRGGEALIDFVAEHAKVPVIRHYKGICHVYVDGEADLDMALAIAVNAKTQRPGVCNAMETLLVDRACADAFLPRAAAALQKVELRGDPDVVARVPRAKPASDADWDTEHLDLILNVRVVDGLDGALAHIARHGSNHTEAIVTERRDRGERFVREVDASLVLVNASTRFNDGNQLGLGAEIGISTTKLHAYGPMGLSELCTLKWIGYGEGQIRGS